MAIKRILCPLYGAESDGIALRTGLRLARRFYAQADVVFVRPNPADALPYLGEGISGPVVEDIIETARKAADEAEKATRLEAARAAEDLGVPQTDHGDPGKATMRIRVRTGRAADIAAQESRLADLVVVADAAARDQTTGPSALETCMLSEGRPVLLAPAASPEAIGTHAAIGWDESTAAANAVAAALPFLADADAVTIISIDEDGGGDASGARALAEYLALHGIDAKIRLLPGQDRRTGEVLLEEAAALGADLLVMGGYGHSRLRQLMLGGVTRHVRSNATVPVLLAH